MVTDHEQHACADVKGIRRRPELGKFRGIHELIYDRNKTQGHGCDAFGAGYNATGMIHLKNIGITV